MTAKFVADVGGTNIRLASIEDGLVTEIKRFKCAEFATIVDAIQHYLMCFPTSLMLAALRLPARRIATGLK